MLIKDELEVIKNAKKLLARDPHTPAAAIRMIQDLYLVEQAGLQDYAWGRSVVCNDLDAKEIFKSLDLFIKQSKIE